MPSCLDLKGYSQMKNIYHDSIRLLLHPMCAFLGPSWQHSFLYHINRIFSYICFFNLHTETKTKLHFEVLHPVLHIGWNQLILTVSFYADV